MRFAEYYGIEYYLFNERNNNVGNGLDRSEIGYNAEARMVYQKGTVKTVPYN